ncbi:ThiF family adenylyltransferase [Bradyrhizobium sp. SZCCHNR3015]|uniref:ThiF family adenylyltransferase n=1 Tax=Bradyrhizobium sp. SZCCHNR3015 TaxID=3057395 RepID=UPI00291665BE|nr:ThiF family adenylyltransferase [Bradyrhizobium sp. SZCCHNR3015]
MAEFSLNAKSWHLIIPEGLYGRLQTHLFRADRDEHGAVISAGMSRTSDGRIRLLARAVHLAQDGVDYVAGKRGYRMLRAQFIRDRILECRDERLVYLAVHNHGGTTSVGFSGDDYRSHERGYPALLDIARGMPVGALVFAEHAIAGDIWLPYGRRVELTDASIIGRRLQKIAPAPVRYSDIVGSDYDRQVRLFGGAGQVILSKAKVAVIGVGGVGSLLVQYLAHLGVGHFVVIDPERIEGTNLPRVVGATRWDARTVFTRAPWPRWFRRMAESTATPKVKIASRVARAANKHSTIEVLKADVLEPEVAAKLLDCDYLFLAADTMGARLLVNAIIHQYLIPGVQVGSKIVHEKETGIITGVHTIVRPITPDSGCLWCNGLINRAKLQEEAQTEREREAQRYVDEPTIVAPSVITLNAVGASQAVNDFLFYMTGLRSDDASNAYMRFDPRARGIALDNPRRSWDCTECGSGSNARSARGDLGKRLPTKHKSGTR